nr:reverse transcriptase domain-containing protein [Tanacetum cinerariifolium]
MEELCQPSLNGWGGPISPIAIQETNFGLKNDMIQQVSNSCQFHGLPGDDANKYLDKFLHVTQSIKVNGVTDDAIRLYLFPHYLTHHATAWFDRLLRNSNNTFEQMAKMFLGKYFPPLMITKLRNEITNFHQRGTFMKRRPEECYDLVENMAAHHNDWDTSAKRSESSSSITYSSDMEIAALKAEMAKINKNLMRVLQVNQQVKAVTPNCKTCGGPHSFSNYPATGNNQGRNQFFQGANQGQNQPLAYQAPDYQALVHQPQIPQPQVVTTNEFTNFIKENDAILKNMQTNMTSLTNSNLELKNMFGQFMKMNTASSSGSRTLSGNTITNPKEYLKGITTRSGAAYQVPTIPTTTSSLPVVERETEANKDTMHPTNNESTKDVQPSVVLTESLILNSEPVISPITEPVASPVSAPRPSHRPSIPYPSRLQDQKLRDKANDHREKIFQIFKDLNFNISFADALILMPKFGPSTKSLLNNKDKLCELARTPLNEHYSTVLLKNLSKKLGDPGKFLILCDFPGMAECLVLADLGTSINLMPLSVLNKLSLPDLSLTCMTLELADRSISRPVGVAEDVFVKVEAFLNDDPSLPLLNQGNYLPKVRKELKIYEAKYDKSSIDELPEVELKDLPPHLEYAFLEGDDKLPVIIAKDLSIKEKTALITVMKSHKRKPHSLAHTERLLITACLLGYAMHRARFRDALEGGPIRPRWMYPFERFMKKLKNYVRNKAKSEGSIAEGYVAEEALTFGHVDKDLGVSASSELFALACGPTRTLISVNSCLVNGVSLSCTAAMNVAQLKTTTFVRLVRTEKYIIDVDEDNDIIDDEDVPPYDLAYYDDEDLVNVDDDDGAAMPADVSKGHGGDDVSDDRPPLHESAGGCRGKGTSQIWEAGKPTECIPVRKPKTSAPHAIRALARYQEGHRSTSWQDLHGQQVIVEEGLLDWDAQIRFWSDPKNMARCAQNAGNRAKSTVVGRQGFRTLAAHRDMQTFFDTHTVGGVFLRDEDQCLYEEMVRLQGLGTYTDDQIMAMVHRGKQRGHIPGVGKVLARKGKDVLDVPVPQCNHTSDLQSQHESRSSIGCGAGEDDESGDDEDADEDADS